MIVFETTFSGSASHTIELRPIGNGRIDLDTFVVLR
jgi:hypothetical protein